MHPSVSPMLGPALLLVGIACSPAGSHHTLKGPLVDLPGIHSAPGLITRPTAVLFWLAQSDTLADGARTEGQDAMLTEAATLRTLLEEYGIPVEGVSAPQIYVSAPGAPRRTIMLTGLDYPWGVVLVDPGYPEEILTGPVDPAELEEIAWDYFLLEDGARGPERVVTDGRSHSPVSSIPRPMPWVAPAAHPVHGGRP